MDARNGSCTPSRAPSESVDATPGTGNGLATLLNTLVKSNGCAGSSGEASVGGAASASPPASCSGESPKTDCRENPSSDSASGVPIRAETSLTSTGGASSGLPGRSRFIPTLESSSVTPVSESTGCTTPMSRSRLSTSPEVANTSSAPASSGKT